MQSFTLDYKTVLVTGGYGFIMSNLINYINDNFYNVDIINIDKCGAGSNKSNINKPVNNNDIFSLHMECESPKFIKVLKEYKPDLIIHGAAESHVDRSITDPLNFVQSNVLGTTNVIHAVDWYQKNINSKCKCVLVSTDEVYGHLSPADPPWDEDSPIEPRSPYASSKAAADLIALSFNTTFKTDFCIVRGCNNFGPRQDHEKLMPKYITTILQGKKMPVYGSGTNIREWVFVDDFCRFILDKAMNYTSGSVYNYGCGVSRTNIDILQELYACMELFCRRKDCNLVMKYKKFEDSIEYVEDRKGHDFRYAMRSKYGYTGKSDQSFRKQLYRTVEFYYEQSNKQNKAVGCFAKLFGW